MLPSKLSFEYDFKVNAIGKILVLMLASVKTQKEVTTASALLVIKVLIARILTNATKKFGMRTLTA